jgi:hypothetical protein
MEAAEWLTQLAVCLGAIERHVLVCVDLDLAGQAILARSVAYCFPTLAALEELGA